MASYSLSGSGVQVLTAGTTQLYVVITTRSYPARDGQANPVNRFDQGLIRPGVDGFYYPTIPIDADQQIIDLPAGTTEIGYALLFGGVIRVGEGAAPAPPVSGSFGYTTVGASTDDIAGNMVWLKATSTPADNATLDHILVYAQQSIPTDSLLAALYTDNAGVPGTLIAGSTTPVPVTSTAQWYSVPLTCAVTAGTQYWFGLHLANTTGDLVVAYDTIAGSEGYFQSDFGETWPADGSAAAPFANERWSVYGTYS